MAAPDWLILGDSHAICVVDAARASAGERRLVGGPLQNGPAWTRPFAAPDAGPIRFTDPGSQERLAQFLAEAGHDGGLESYPGPILVSAGFHITNIRDNALWRSHRIHGLPDRGRHFLSAQIFETLLASLRRDVIAFLLHLARSGRAVTVYPNPPPRFPEARDPDEIAEAVGIYRACVDRLGAVYRKAGIRVLDLQDRTTAADGTLREEFWSGIPGDLGHANAAYGRVILEAALAGHPQAKP